MNKKPTPRKRAARSGKSARNEEGGGDDRESELDVFRRRAEWWRLHHGDESGVVSSRLRLQAIAQTERMEAAGLEATDPGGSAPKRGFELLFEKERLKATVSRGKNPRPHSSLGFVSAATYVRGPHDLAGVVLKIALDRDALERVLLDTVRVFSFEEETVAWQLIPRSGIAVTGDYAWAHLHRPGIYIAIGVPADPDTLRALLLAKSALPRLRQAKKKTDFTALIGAINSLAVQRRTSEPVSARAQQLPGLPPNIDLPERGLPEFDILDDLFPPYQLEPRGRWQKLLEIAFLDPQRDPLIPLAPIFLRQWVSAGPPNFNGRIKCLAIHPGNADIVYAGAANGGVWKTTNGGASWRSLMSDEQSMAIGALAVSQSNPQIVYAATGEDSPGWGPSYDGVGVYKTTDGGANWTLLSEIRSARCTRVLIHPTNPDIVYVAGDSGLHKSTDGGGTWMDVRTDHVSDAVMFPTEPDEIYAAVWNNGIFYSVNGGAAWNDFNLGLPTGGAADWIKLSTSRPNADGRTLLVAKMGLNSGRLFTRLLPELFRLGRRTRFGWRAIAGTHEAVDNGYNEWTNLVAVDPTRMNVIFAGGVGLQRSTNSGRSFAQIGGTHSDHHEIVFASNDTDRCYLANDAGVYRSLDNGATWTLQSPGLIATQLYSIGVSQDGTFVLGGASQDQGILRTQGKSDWDNTGAGNEGGIFIVDPNDSTNIYATPLDGNLRRSTDHGSTWTTILNGITLSGTPPTASTVAHLAVAPQNSNLLLSAAGNQVFRSTNQGNDWSPVLTVAAGTTPVFVAFLRRDICYAATDDGRLYVSSSGGTVGSWREPYTAANRPPMGRIAALEGRFIRLVSITSGVRIGQLIYLAYIFGGRVWRSIDGGANWENASGTGAGALPNIPISSLVIDKDLSDTVYVGSDIGVFRTRDGGNNWEPFNTGLPRIIVTGLALRRETNRLYASTMGRGAYTRTLN